MFHDRQDLTALIGSRICHDLISPLGAISNGLELLALSGIGQLPELDLIADSIASANSKIRFFRVAYGMAPHGTTLPQPEITSILGDYFKDSRVSINWQTTREALRRDVKLMFLAIQCAESALPFGGTITVSYTGDEWILSAQSTKLRMVPDHWAVLEGHEIEGDLAAAQVQFGMLATLTRFRKPQISVTTADEVIEIRL